MMRNALQFRVTLLEIAPRLFDEPTARIPLLITDFFFNDTATTEIYTLSLHDALPIFDDGHPGHLPVQHAAGGPQVVEDRKSTRLNSSHEWITYAVFCLKKKKKT